MEGRRLAVGKDRTGDYEGFLSSLGFQSITVPRLNYQHKVNVDPDIHTWSIAPKYDFQAKKTSPGKLSGRIAFSIRVQHPDDASNVLFHISGTILLDYSYDQELHLTKQMTDTFAAFNIPLNGWPYLRELVSDATNRMGLPPLILGPYIVK